MAVRGTVLVVDDSEDTLDMVERMLLETDYAVGRAHTGKEALLLADQNRPDLVLLDIQLPDIDGWKVCERLKAHPKTRHTPIIFMTGLHLESDDIVRGFELGATDYITKPFHGQILVQRVNAAIRAFAVEKELRSLAAGRAEALSALANASVEGLEARALSGITSMASTLIAEIAPPLGEATKHLEALRDSLQDEQRQALEDALRDLIAVKGYVDRMRRLGDRIDSEEISPLQGVVAAFANPIAADLRKRGIDVVLRFDETPPVRGAIRIAPVVAELLNNAAAAVADDGRIELATFADGDWAVLRVSDNGPGMDLSGEWDPFVAPVDPPREGRPLGLGLPMCHSIATGFGGSIELDSTPGEGTRVEVRLPVAPAGEDD